MPDYRAQCATCMAINNDAEATRCPSCNSRRIVVITGRKDVPAGQLITGPACAGRNGRKGGLKTQEARRISATQAVREIQELEAVREDEEHHPDCPVSHSAAWYFCNCPDGWPRASQCRAAISG